MIKPMIKISFLALMALVVSACSGENSSNNNVAKNVANQSWTKKLKQKNEKFRIVQLGDSHTAGDYFTDELRRQLQSKLGNGGIGLVPASKVSGQRTALVSYDGYGFETLTSRRDSGDFPMGGVMTRAFNGSMLISPRNFVRQKQLATFNLKPLNNNAQLLVQAAGTMQKIAGLKAGQWQSQTLTLAIPFSLYPQNGGMELGLINLENEKGGGVVLSNLGINGSQLSHTDRWRFNWWQDLKNSQADLVILAYGTNEAFNDNLDVGDAEQRLRNTIRKIRQTLPNAGVIVIGAPESLRSKAGSCGTRPAMLDAVQAMQKRVTESEKALFWSWEKEMGGRCTMKNWIAEGFAAQDGVHFTAIGYERVARGFARDILNLAK